MDSDADDLIKDISLFMALPGCAEVTLGTGGAMIDLSDAIADAREAYEDLPDKDERDYQEELDAFNKEYAGSIFNLLAKEAEAEMVLEESKGDFNESVGALFDDHAGDLVTKTVAGNADVTLNSLYRQLMIMGETGEDASDAESNEALPTISGVSLTRNADGTVNLVYAPNTGITTSRGDTSPANGTSTAVAVDTTDSAADQVTAFELLHSLNTIDFGLFDDQGNTDDSDDTFEASSSLNHLLLVRQASIDAVADANEALAGNAAEDEGYDFTSRQLADIREYKETHEIRVDRLDDAIKTIRANAAFTSADYSFARNRDETDVIRDYDDALDDIEDALGDGLGDRAALDSAKKAVTGEFRNPISLLEAVINVADKNLQRAVARGDDEDDLKPLRTALANARAAKQAYDDAVADTDNPASDLLRALVAADDTGQALLDAVSANHGSTVANATRLDTLEGDMGDDGQVDQNADDIDVLEGQVEENTTAISGIRSDLYGDTASQHDGPACEASGIAHDAACGKERSGQNATDIEALDGRVSANETMLDDHEMRITANANDIDMLEMEDERLEGRIDTNWDAIAVNQMDIDANEAAIMAEETARMEADTMHDTMIAENKMTGMTNATNIGMNKGMIMSNAEAISGLDGRVGANASAIMRNGDMIGELSESLDVVRAGVAASMALAGMPAVNGRGIAIGVGSFDGESAFAVGFQIAGEQASFKVGVTSSGGATGASAGVGFNF